MYLLFVVVAWIIIGKKFVHWKTWKECYPTIQYFIICNLFYNFLYYNHTLWAYKAKTTPILNHTLIETAFTFLIVPITIMIYLQHFPEGDQKQKKYIYVFSWCFFYWIIEYMFNKKGLFIYDNDWNIWWSAMFNVLMFTMLRVHYKKPLLALILSVPIIIFLIFLFPSPLWKMK